MTDRTEPRWPLTAEERRQVLDVVTSIATNGEPKDQLAAARVLVAMDQANRAAESAGPDEAADADAEVQLLIARMPTLGPTLAKMLSRRNAAAARPDAEPESDE